MAGIDGVPYKVKAGDSLWSIAHKHFGHGAVWPSIFAFNQESVVKARVSPRLRHPDQLEVGQTIYLPRRLFVQNMRRQAGQVHTPGKIGPTRPARGGTGQGASAAPSGHPVAPTMRAPGAPAHDPLPTVSPTPGSGHNTDGGATIVSKFGVKIDTAHHRKFKTQFDVGLFTVEVEFKGTMVVRHDATVPVATFSRANFEYSYKNEMLNAAGALTAVTKLQVDWKKRSGSVETMFSSNLIAGNKLPISLGAVVDEKGPGLRGKVDYKGVQGKVHDILYFVHDDETLSVIVTVRPRAKPPNPNEPPTEPPPGVHVLVPVGVPSPVFAPHPQPLPVPVPGPDVVGVPEVPHLGPDVLPGPATPHPNHDLLPTVSPTPQHADTVLMHAGKWAQDHPVAAVAVGVAVVGLVIVALPEEVVGGAALAVGRWLFVRGAVAVAAGA